MNPIHLPLNIQNKHYEENYFITYGMQYCTFQL